MIVLEWLLTIVAPCDAAEPWQLGSQDAATPMMQGIIYLHHDILFFLIVILVFVSRMLVRVLWHFYYEFHPFPQRIVHGTTIEILWTIFPSIIPKFIAIPSFAELLSAPQQWHPLRFGDGGPTVGNSRHKHLTEGDQRFYSSTEEPFAARSKGCRERWEVTEN